MPPGPSRLAIGSGLLAPMVFLCVCVCECACVYVFLCVCVCVCARARAIEAPTVFRVALLCCTPPTRVSPNYTLSYYSFTHDRVGLVGANSLRASTFVCLGRWLDVGVWSGEEGYTAAVHLSLVLLLSRYSSTFLHIPPHSSKFFHFPHSRPQLESFTHYSLSYYSVA